MRHGTLKKPVKGVGAGFPVLFSGGPLPELAGAPTLGMHNDEVYNRLLGLGGEELQRLKAQGVV
jgi:crotonobetainyl-CoA:carnitine CoA-transferase CaiB-like acyl-CoA transferase